MAERAVQAVKRPQQARSRYHLHQQRQAVRDLPLCIPQLRLAWTAFGVGIASVLLSLCLMIGGAASSNTVYGGKQSSNMTAVYVGIVFLVIGLAALGFFGFCFSRIRHQQKVEFLRRDSGHENAAFPVSEERDLTQIAPKLGKFNAPSLPDSTVDSAYSSLVMNSSTGSELNAKRLSDAMSEKSLIYQRSAQQSRGAYPGMATTNPSHPSNYPKRPQTSSVQSYRPNSYSSRDFRPQSNSHIYPDRPQTSAVLSYQPNPYNNGESRPPTNPYAHPDRPQTVASAVYLDRPNPYNARYSRQPPSLYTHPEYPQTSKVDSDRPTSSYVTRSNISQELPALQTRGYVAPHNSRATMGHNESHLPPTIGRRLNHHGTAPSAHNVVSNGSGMNQRFPDGRHAAGPKSSSTDTII